MVIAYYLTNLYNEILLINKNKKKILLWACSVFIRPCLLQQARFFKWMHCSDDF